MVSEQLIMNTLKGIVDPQSGKDIVTLGYVNSLSAAGGKVACSVAEPFKSKVEEVLLSLDGIDVVKITTIKQGSSLPDDALSKVKSIIAISSCKGGVGKSTMAVHLAQELASRGQKTGLIDADIFGPSLPTLFNLHNPQIYTNKKQQLIPLQHNKLKIMSFGFLLGDAPAVMRGPIVTRYIQQLLLATDWGELDYLLIDMPPGTGDVHLTITQTVRLAGAVIVTTPHTLSLVDVARGILMFEKVDVPILGVIENMSYFQDNKSDEKHYIFGKASSNTLQNSFGIRTLGEIPILPALSQSADKYIANEYIQNTADALLQSIHDAKKSEKNVPKIQFDHKEIKLSWQNNETWTVKNFDLRLNSQDALSVNEVTGEKILKAEDIRKDIAATEITPLGNYAIGVSWNDGHKSGIYPYKSIKELALVSTNC